MATKARAFQLACRRHTSSAVHHHHEQSNPLPRRRLTRTATTSANPGKGAQPTRRAITVTSDDGRYRWSELSTGEKAARSTQQSFNFILAAAGAVGTATVAYFLYQELIAPDSKTRQFNHAVDRIKASAECRELLGPASKIVAFGEPTTSKWARARPIAHTTETDRFGTTHFRMHFNVEGPDGRGVVQVHMTKKSTEDELSYKLLALVVPGRETVYLEREEVGGAKAVKKFFGLKLG